MDTDFSKLFHHASRGSSQGKMPAQLLKEGELPPETRTILYKSYSRLPQTLLPTPQTGLGVLEALKNRSSVRSFTGTPLSLSALATILAYSCGEIGAPISNGKKRAQPSGGPLYPIETYIFIFQSSNELASGVYHYNVRDHALELLWAREFTQEDIAKLFVYEWVADASAAIMLTGTFDRSKIKYGQRGYRYALLEAGHIGQNVYLAAGELGIGCCAMGGTKDREIEKLLHIDGERECLIYSLVLGSHK